MANVFVAVVVDPCQSARKGVVDNLLAGQLEQWSQDPAIAFRHGACTAHPGTTEQVEQHGLGAILNMMTKQKPVPVGPAVYVMPSPASGSLQPVGAAPLDRHLHDLQADVEFRAQAPAMADPVGSMAAEAVIDVDRPRLAAQRHQGAKKHNGVDATGEPDQEDGPGRHGMAGKAGRNGRLDGLSGGRVP